MRLVLDQSVAHPAPGPKHSTIDENHKSNLTLQHMEILQAALVNITVCILSCTNSAVDKNQYL